MYILDTNIIIAFFKGDEAVGAAIRQWQSAATTLVTSTMTLTELLALPDITKSEEDRIKEFLLSTRTVSVNWRIAELAAHVRRRYRLKIADSLTAATAWHEATVLITRNIRDFRKVKELEVRSA
jgi:predicted nucleic acid-binding protein